MTTELIHYDQARHALQVAYQIDEVKELRDKALALAAYARQVNNTDMLKWVTDIKLRAERRAGEILAETERNKGGQPQHIENKEKKSTGNIVLPVGKDAPPTLNEVHFSKKQSSDFQAIAALAEKEFEAIVAKGKATTASLVREGKGKQKPTKKAGRPKTVKVPAVPPDMVPKAKYDELEADFIDLQDKHEELIITLEAMTVPKDEQTVKIEQLKLEIRQLKRARDDLMNKTCDMRKQIDYWEKQAKKLGWTSKTIPHGSNGATRART